MKDWNFDLIIPKEYDNKTVRDYLREYLFLPKHLISSLRRSKRILINGNYLPMNFKIHSGDQAKLTFKPKDFPNAYPSVKPDDSQKIEVLFENPDLLIINKHQGNKTHANQPNELGSSMNFAEAYLQPGSDAFMVHRLDKQTSGALIIAKNPAVVPALVHMLKYKQIKRTYLAMVHGQLEAKVGSINSPIGFDPDDKRKRKVNGYRKQNAVTNYKVLNSKNGKSLLQIELKTGRTHQIRVHLASVGHPVINDPLYDNGGSGDQMMLHSYSIQMSTPFYYQTLEVKASVPENFKL